MKPLTKCPACGSGALDVFHNQSNVPTNSCLLVDSQADALGFSRGDIELTFCPQCGFIFNARFDPDKAEYVGSYEETQGFSTRFVEFAAALARSWVDDHDLAGKTVLEIGSGKGEFLRMMAAAGIGHGIGVDPGVDMNRITGAGSDRCEWIGEFFDAELVAERGADLQADAIVCRHTLEHIQPVGEFLDSIRSLIGDRLETVVLFELPDTRRVLEEVAFWDVYYEHCSYFSAGSLSRLFESHGFEVTNVRLAYDDQYLLLEAKPKSVDADSPVWPADDIPQLRDGIEIFRHGYAGITEEWGCRLSANAIAGRKAVIWGAGSKGVAFLGAAGSDVVAAVDINPHMSGKFMAGTGHPIVPPSALTDIDPSLIVAMNPVYLGEIQAELDRLGIGGELIAL